MDTLASTIVIFGAIGRFDARRKLVPALYELFRKKRLPAGTRIVGFSRTPITHEAWRGRLAESAAKFLAGEFNSALWSEFAAADVLPRGRYRKGGRFCRPEQLSP